MQGYWPNPCGFPRGLPAKIWPTWVSAHDEFEVAPGASTCWASICPSSSQSQNACLEEDDVRQTVYFSTKILNSELLNHRDLSDCQGEMEGKKRKENHAVFHKSLLSSTLRAKIDKGLWGSPLTKSLFAAPVCTYKKLHEEHLQNFLLWVPYNAYDKTSSQNNYISRKHIGSKLKFWKYCLEVDKEVKESVIMMWGNKPILQPCS